MTKLKISIFLFLLILPFITTAQENKSELVSCFDNYNFGSINLDKIAPDKKVYQQGETIHFQGLVENHNDYPIVQGSIFGRLIHLGSSPDPLKNSDTVIDEFFVKDDINILANGAYPLEFDYKLPLFAPKGQYQFATYFVVAKKFNLSGVSFLSNMYGGLTTFEINSSQYLDYFIDRDSFKINGKKYVFRDFNPIFSPNTDIKIEFKVKNITNKQGEGQILYKLYKWDSLLEEENLIKYDRQNLFLYPQSSNNIVKIFPKLSPNVYLLKIISNINNQTTIADIRFAIEGTKARINFSALKKFPFNKNQKADYFTCFHISSSYDKTLNGSVITDIYDKNNVKIAQYIYNGEIYPDILSFVSSFLTKDNYKFLKINSTVLDNNNFVLDTANIIYDCSIGATIANKLSFFLKDNKIYVFGINWCGDHIPVNLEEVILRNLDTDQIVLVRKNISSTLLKNLSLEAGQYEGIFKSGPFLLSEYFEILSFPPLPSMTDIFSKSDKNLPGLILAITFLLLISIIYIVFKRIKRRKLDLYIFLLIFVFFIFGNNTYAADIKLKCQTNILYGTTGQNINFRAYGGDKNNYSWFASEGNPSSGAGRNFKTSFNSIGTKEIIVSSKDQKASCYIFITNSSKNLPCKINEKQQENCSLGIISTQIQNFFGTKISGLRPKGGSAGSAGGITFAIVIKNPLRLIQGEKIIRDGDIISLNNPIFLDLYVDTESFPKKSIPRTNEPGGPSGGAGPAGPIGKEEPAGPIGITEPGGPIGIIEPAGPTGEWVFAVALGDSPPVTFSNQCDQENFIPDLYFIGGGEIVSLPGGAKTFRIKTTPASNKNEKGVNKEFAIGVCAKIGQTKVIGMNCNGNQCHITNSATQELSKKIIIEQVIYIKGVMVKNPFTSSQDIISSPIYEKMMIYERNLLLNLPPLAKASYKIQDKQYTDQILLDAQQSFDPNKGPSPLSYKWSIIDKPSGSLAKIKNNTNREAIFEPGIKGKYKIKLVVSDGLDESSNILELDNVGNSNLKNQPTIITPNNITDNDKISVLCDNQKICKTTLTPGNFNEIYFEVINSKFDNTIISFYNIPQGITLTSKPSFLKPGQKSGQIIVSASNSTLPGKYTSIVRFRQGSKFIELPIEIEVINTRFPPLPPTVEILPRF